MEPFVVFGNPINHSKSPFIHQLFAMQTGIEHRYGRVLVPLGEFEPSVEEFFRQGEGGQCDLTL